MDWWRFPCRELSSAKSVPKFCLNQRYLRRLLSPFDSNRTVDDASKRRSEIHQRAQSLTTDFGDAKCRLHGIDKQYQHTVLMSSDAGQRCAYCLNYGLPGCLDFLADWLAELCIAMILSECSAAAQAHSFSTYELCAASGKIRFFIRKSSCKRHLGGRPVNTLKISSF